jgi:hypothetical protein
MNETVEWPRNAVSLLLSDGNFAANRQMYLATNDGRVFALSVNIVDNMPTLCLAETLTTEKCASTAVKRRRWWNIFW